MEMDIKQFDDFDNETGTVRENLDHYFKSSFARSIISESLINESKSLDYLYANNKEMRQSQEENTFIHGNFGTNFNGSSSPSFRSVSKSANASPIKASTSTPRYSNHIGNKPSITSIPCKVTQTNVELARNHLSTQEEISKLKLECEHLKEENRKLQRSSVNSPSIAFLQSHTDTLQWQLKQTEAHREMYRAVMEQVGKFLEKFYKSTETSLTSSSSCRGGKSRVPRSRSVHTMAGYKVSNSRCSSPSPTHQSSKSTSNKTNSPAHLHQQDTKGTNFGEYTCKPACPTQEEISLEKLSQEAFRLYRTVQSLLNTKEPDLTRCGSYPETIYEKPDTASVGSCSSYLLESSYGGTRKSLDASSSCSTNCTTGDELDVITTRNTDTPTTAKSAHIEDESGFSSMSSFHETNNNNNCLPEIKSYPEIGVPLVDFLEPNHRRWNSNPVDPRYKENRTSIHFCNNNDLSRVLWV